tara:strand:+ start:3830 stop:4159 length:330 start_codon:yes stop_codon:yes gene_type:complete
MAYFDKLVNIILNAWSDGNVVSYEYTPSYDKCGSGIPTCMWADVADGCLVTILRSPYQSDPGHYDCMLHITNMNDDGGPVTKSYYIASSDDYAAAEKALLIELLLWVEL